MFKLVYVLQCVSDGKFLTPRLNYTYNLNLAGRFDDRQAAVDTGLNELDLDFIVYELYQRVV